MFNRGVKVLKDLSRIKPTLKIPLDPLKYLGLV